MLHTPPDAVVVDGRIARFGMFAGPIRDTDLRSFRWYGPLARLRLKQWHHYAVVHPKFSLTFAFVDAGYTRLAWLQAVDRTDGHREEVHRQAPWLALHVPPHLFDERGWVRAADLAIEVHNDLGNQRHHLEIRTPFLQAELDLDARTPPLEVVLPVGRGRAMWSHKVPLATTGTVRWHGQVELLEPAHTTTILDLHKAHYPHRTWWHWATFAGRDTQGRAVAANLTRNLVEDPGYHECALWVDGHLELLEPATFQVAEDPWTARGPGVDLAFTALGERREDLAVGPIVSRFRQRYGTWTGSVRGHVLEGAFGLAEDHHSRW